MDAYSLKNNISLKEIINKEKQIQNIMNKQVKIKVMEA